MLSSQNRKKYYKLLKAGQYWKHLPEELQEEAMGSSYYLSGGRTGFYRRLFWDRLSPTLVTRPNMPATDLCHPTKLRPLSIDEYERIQGFDDDWKSAGSLIEQYRQVGNAVPVSMAYVAGKAIIDFHECRLKTEIRNGVKYSRYNKTTDRDLSPPKTTRTESM